MLFSFNNYEYFSHFAFKQRLLFWLCVRKKGTSVSILFWRQYMTLLLGFHSNRLVSHGVCVCVFFVALDKGIKLLGIMKIIGIENLRETNLSFPLPKKYASELHVSIIFLSIFLDVDIRKREEKVDREKDVPRNSNILVCYHTQMCRCKAINHLQPTNFSCIFSIG